VQGLKNTVDVVLLALHIPYENCETLDIGRSIQAHSTLIFREYKVRTHGYNLFGPKALGIF